MENINDNFNIVVQLARADEELVEKLRGSININQKDRRSGVRRCFINENGTHEVEVLENINMADPKTLYSFLLWGLNNYPSDYVNVFYNLYKITKKKIELLLLDSCYMNLIEIWYKFANIAFNPIKYLLIDSENVDIDGISYTNFIRYLPIGSK